MMSRKRIVFLLAFLLIAFVHNLAAQNHIISGKITDAQNRQPLAFVNVVVNEGLTGTMSDIDGRYDITSDEPIRKVKFSSIGYEPKEITIESGQKKYFCENAGVCMERCYAERG